MEIDFMGHMNPAQDRWAIAKLARECSAAYAEKLFGKPDGPPTAVEIGAWAGDTTLTLADAGFRVYAVDTWAGSPSDGTSVNVARFGGPERIFQTFCKNVGPLLLGDIVPLRGSSHLWASIWPNTPIHLLFIDADHSYLHCLHDITRWSQFVIPGGIIAGHDFGVFDGVTRAVSETGQYGVIGSVWWRIKPLEQPGNGAVC